MATIQNADQAIDALGGTSRVASLFGFDARVVSNWRARGLPPNTYDVMGRLLAGPRPPLQSGAVRAASTDAAAAGPGPQARPAAGRYQRHPSGELTPPLFSPP